MRSFGLNDLLMLIHGLEWTAWIAFLALALGGPVALLVAVVRSSKNVLLYWISVAFIQIIQGIPLLGLLMFFYFGVPLIAGVSVPSIVAVLITFTIFTAAYLGEIWRGSLQAIKPTQWEAAACLGLSRVQQFTHVIAPQAARISLPPTVNFLVQLIKNTSLASIVGFVELTRAGTISSAATFQPLLVYSVVAVMYFSICFPLAFLAKKLEGKMNGVR